MDTLFRCRINNVDHYQATPVSEFDPPLPRSSYGNNRERHRISVIRVFGATETGQKVLMHIHGILQYTYIEYSGSLAREDVQVAIRTLQLSIDHALAVSYRQNVYESKNKYVAHISLVKGVPFYGYHVGYKHYLKVYLLNPLHMTRLADLLREGAVMKRVLQPHESHMQYIAQWMCDYNLYGCAYIDCAKVKFRGPVPHYFDLTSSLHPWHDQSIPQEFVSDPVTLPKQSHCALEVDVRAEDILNRQSVEPRELHQDFVERVRPLRPDMKFMQSTAGLWKDETRRRKARLGIKDPNTSPFPPEVLISMSADPRNAHPGGWIHEQEYRDKISQIAAQEHEQNHGRHIGFDNFLPQLSQEGSVQTALESVEDMYSYNIGKLLAEDDALAQSSGMSGEQVSQVVVDENLVRGYASAEAKTESSLTESGKALANGSSNSNLLQPSSTGTSSDSEVRTPISSSEYAELGIRQTGDPITHGNDDFNIPSQYLAADKPKKTSTKRVRIQEPVSQSTKRMRITNASPYLLEDDFPKDIEGNWEQNLGQSYSSLENDSGADASLVKASTAEQAGNQLCSESPEAFSGSQNSTLRFSIVKNPNDPNTLLRLSQQSSQSQKLSQRSNDLQTEAQKLKSQGLSGTSRNSDIKVPSPGEGFPSLRGLRKPGSRSKILVLSRRPPKPVHVENTMGAYGLPDVIYTEAHYGKEKDVPDRQREYAGREFKLESTTIPYLPDFDSTGKSLATFGLKPPVLVDRPAEDLADRQRRQRCSHKHWNIGVAPPRKIDVSMWLEIENKLHTDTSRFKAQQKPSHLSQIEGPTQNKHGFKYSQKRESTSVQHETQYMSVMSLEVHVNTRGSLAPNPEEDEIACVFWCVQTDDEDIDSNTGKESVRAGMVLLSEHGSMSRRVAQNLSIEVEEEQSELEVLTRIVDIVRRYDPDILTGYEVHNNSWGYLIERARQKYDLNFCDEISRMKSQSHGRFGRDEDRWGFNHTSTIRVTGRHTINIWRAMRGELNLLQYTMENVVFHVLHRRIPHYAFADLTRWYKSRRPKDVAKVIEYFASRVQIDLEILEGNELVPRTSEQARLIGVDWFSVISRGSQFKVENIMFRIAKPENFILVSPGRRQVGGQNALECLPLVMEPQSDFYSSPMLVLDFQSLYPSVMIAYNYCYSTFLGRIVNWRGTNKMGFTDYHRQERLIELLRDYINIAPNGIMYAKKEIRTSLLAKMLSEILETRVMVKSGMKADKDDKTLQQLLNNRQLALKLIANVTYGYTSASFSGRMPCSEIADSIVQTGRETLEKAIALIHSVRRWKAEVVYGDTDSLFVYLKGRTREQAFDIGEEIAKAITEMNPRPVKLKFEKVYHPCVLLAKKRYVGFKYESRKQAQPEFEAKGIETVRRDGTPAEQKIEENALKVLFRTANLTDVKAFFQAQCAKIMLGRVSIQDFCFAREVRLGTYSDKGPPPPGALISARRMLEDPRLEPQYGERVPYVVVTGGPGARLIDRCVAPEVLLNDAQQELDAEYYISKNIIPPLERIFNLVGANVRQWYDEMPKYQRIRRVEGGSTDGTELVLSRKTMESYMKSSSCVVCREPLDSELGLCSSCLRQAPQSLLHLRAILTRGEKKKSQLETVCRSCAGLAWNDEVRCDSKDCPVFYSRTRQNAALTSSEAEVNPIVRMLEGETNHDIEW